MADDRATRTSLILLEAFVAVSAWGGAVSFVTGGADVLARRLPGPGRAVGALGLAVCIAAPMTAVAVAVAHRRPQAGRLALGTALVLALWLLGQTIFVGFSFLQPALLVVAGLIALLASRLQRQVPLSG